MNDQRSNSPPPSVFGNPIVQTVMAVVGAWFVMNLARTALPFLFWAALAFALWTVWVLWSLRFDRLRLAAIYQNPVARSLVDVVCRIAKEQAPVEGPIAVGVPSAAPAGGRSDSPDSSSRGGVAAAGAAKADASTLRLRRPEDFRDAEARLVRIVRGHDAVIGSLVESLRRAIELRGQSEPGAVRTPLGIYVLGGPEGVGKRYLAAEIAQELFGPGSSITVDCSAGGDPAEMAIAAFRSRPESVLIVESVERASPRFLEFLEVVAANGGVIDPSTNKPVSFRRGFVFLLTARAGELPAEAPQENRGFTQMARAVGQEIGLSPRLSHHVTEYFSLGAPAAVEVAEALVLMMESECRKYGLALGRVEPDVLAKEVQILGDGFAVGPARVAKLLRKPILEAKNAGRSQVFVG